MTKTSLLSFCGLLVTGIAVLQIGACGGAKGGGPSATHAKPNDERHAAVRGDCSPTDRTNYVHDPNPKFIGELRTCSHATWANRAKNIECLAKAMPALSAGCAGCFADMASCSVDNCKLACMTSSTSEGCIKCANTHCQASLIGCTGVARADLP